MPTTGKGTWTVNDNDDFDLPIDLAATANSIDGWTTSRYERRAATVGALGTGDYIGQRALVSPYTNAFNEYYWSGAAWRAVKITGVISGVSLSGGATNVRSYTFPTNAFAAWPMVQAIAMGSNSRGVVITIDSVSATSVSFRLHNSTDVAREFDIHFAAETRTSGS